MRNKRQLLLGAGFLALSAATSYFIYDCDRKRKKSDKMRETYESYFNLLKQMVTDKYENHSIASFFHDNNYSEIIVYGLGSFGEILRKELEETDINIKCFIDKQANDTVVETSEIPLYALDEFDFDNETADAIVVTAPMYFEEIKKNLIRCGAKAEIVSVSDVILNI